MKTVLFPFTIVGVALAGCAPMEAEPMSYAGVDTSRQCFFTDSINGYGDAPDGPNGEERLIVSTGPSDDWLFEVRGACPDIDYAQQIAFDTNSRISICTGNTETLLVPTTLGNGLDRCQVRLLGKVTDESLLSGSEGA